MSTQDIINEFKTITGVDDEMGTIVLIVASHFLEASKGDLQDALSAFYEKDLPKAKHAANKFDNINSRIKTFQELRGNDTIESQNMYAGGEKSYY
jgi:hypothetical protein